MTGIVLPGVGARAVARRRTWQLPWVMGACFVFIGVVVVMAVFGAALAPYGPGTQNLALTLAKPSAAHLLGTDSLGRDVFSRLIAGARTACVGPVIIAYASMLLGNVLGLLAGYRGGLVDSVIMRWVDLMWSVPSLLVIIVGQGPSAAATGYRWSCSSC